MRSTLQNFRQTIARLRDPEKGCPWDLKQSHGSLKKYFIEEVYEFLHEVDKEDLEGMEEELGDVLLQIYLHAQLLEEETSGSMNLETIASKINAKIIHRHPHVFDPDFVESGKSVEEIWKETKSQESSESPKADPFHETLGFPPLQRVEKIYRELKGKGFKFPTHRMALEKVREEVDEVLERLDRGDIDGLKEELGDLTLAICSATIEFDYSPEELLQASLHKFNRRWERFSGYLSQESSDLSTLPYEKILEFWTRSKHE